MPRQSTGVALAVGAVLAGRCAAYKTLNVMDFGAKGDGAALDTAAIRNTFAAAEGEGAAEVVFPPGYTFLTRPFNITSNLLLSVHGTIMFSDDPTADWPLIPMFQWFGPTTSPQYQPCIMGWGVSNVTITGGGVVDGNGTKWWPCGKNPALPPCFGTGRPASLLFTHGGSFLTISNITFKDSPQWNLRPAFMDYVHIFNVAILAPDSAAKVNPSHNTDGIDPDCCRHVMVEDSYVSVGDDAIAVKAGKDWYGRTYGRPSYNLTFRNIRVGTAHGVSIGSEMSAGVSDVLFENFTLDGTATGPRIKTQRGRGGYVANVTFRNFRLSNVNEAISVSEYYSDSGPPTNASATPRFYNFTISNLTSVDVPNSKKAVGFFVAGLPESIIDGLTLEDVDVGSPYTVVGNCSFATGSCRGRVKPHCPPCLT